MKKENDSWEKARGKIEKFKTEVINLVFPNARFASSSMFGSPEQAPNSFKPKLSTGELLKGTDYEYDGDGKYIHFTSLIGLKLILESGFLRMSEFGNLIDEKEILYAASVFEGNPLFKFDQKKLKHSKENLFCLSLCQSNDSTKHNRLMWEVYGDKGKGAIIELEINKQDPYSFLLGKIQYGEEALKPIKRLKSLAEEFSKTHDGFFPNNFMEFILEMQSFHKVKIFESEEEIRFLMKEDKGRYESHNQKTIYKDINSNQEVKYFNKLYLKERYPFQDLINPENKINILDTFPQILIRNIILGYNISNQNKVNLMFFLNDIKEQYKYNFKISQMNDEGEIFEMR
ncbi:MAG: hypothetical protein Q8S44_00485 [Flavobacteriaceae bacterium]|nr:hypothetical protein [Flavobacteriaceae bacterium]